MTAIATAMNTPTYNVLELAGTAEDNIDRTKKVIRRVKILGLESTNKARVLGLNDREFGKALDHPYRYARSALKAAIPLYEGATVYLNHLQSTLDRQGVRVIEERDRALEEKFGWLTSVTLESDGLYGDLNYLGTHPAAEQVLETISRRPGELGLSHNSFIRPELIDGRVVIVEIGEVKSVDLIGEKPGTTANIFESAVPKAKGRSMKITPRQILEKAPRRTDGYRELRAAIELGDRDDEVLKAAADRDMEFEEGRETMDGEVPAVDHKAQVKGALAAMVTAVFDDDSLDAAATMAKIKDILDAQEKLLGGGEKPKPATIEADHPEDHDPEKKVAQEADADEKKAAQEAQAREETAALKRKVEVLERQGTARDDLEGAGLTPTAGQVRTYAAIENNTDRDEYIDGLKESLESKDGRGHIEPRSASPRGSDDDDDDAFGEPDGKKFAAALR